MDFFAGDDSFNDWYHPLKMSVVVPIHFQNNISSRMAHKDFRYLWIVRLVCLYLLPSVRRQSVLDSVKLVRMAMLSIVAALSFCFFAGTRSQWALRQYFIQKDFFTGIKAGEFSIYDQSRTNLLYRLESRYGLTQTAELYAYPGKQLVASIRNLWSPWSKRCLVTWRFFSIFTLSFAVYDAEIRVFDTVLNQWITGRITQSFPGYRFRYDVRYINRRLTMDHQGISLTAEIRDTQQPDYVLARVRQRLESVLWSNRYDLQVYTNDLPDVIYILALSAYDYNHSNRIIRSAQNGWTDSAQRMHGFSFHFPVASQESFEGLKPVDAPLVHLLRVT